MATAGVVQVGGEWGAEELSMAATLGARAAHSTALTCAQIRKTKKTLKTQKTTA